MSEQKQQNDTQDTNKDSPSTVSNRAKANQLAATIAEQLGETEDTPRAQIRRAVKILGAEQTLIYLRETLEIEAGEGLMLPDGSRRRTPGGVFFHLLRTRTAKAYRKHIFPPPRVIGKHK